MFFMLHKKHSPLWRKNEKMKKIFCLHSLIEILIKIYIYVLITITVRSLFGAICITMKKNDDDENWWQMEKNFPSNICKP